MRGVISIGRSAVGYKHTASGHPPASVCGFPSGGAPHWPPSCFAHVRSCSLLFGSMQGTCRVTVSRLACPDGQSYIGTAIEWQNHQMIPCQRCEPTRRLVYMALAHLRRLCHLVLVPMTSLMKCRTRRGGRGRRPHCCLVREAVDTAPSRSSVAFGLARFSRDRTVSRSPECQI